MCTACANVRKKIDLDFEVTSGARLIYSLGQNYEEWFTHDTNTRKSTCESGRCKHRRNGSIFCQQANKCIQSHWLFPKMVTEIEEKHCAGLHMSLCLCLHLHICFHRTCELALKKLYQYLINALRAHRLNRCWPFWYNTMFSLLKTGSQY